MKNCLFFLSHSQTQRISINFLEKELLYIKFVSICIHFIFFCAPLSKSKNFKVLL